MLNWIGGNSTRSTSSHTALIDLQGEIGVDQVNADSVISSLQEAYENKHTKQSRSELC